MASVKPRTYYGLHMVEGCAEYREPGQAPYRIFLNEKTCKEMDPSYEGCPVYVRHVDEVDLANIQEEADGFVINSFFNKADGRHWVKFIIVSDRGHEAISQKKWRLSNAYIVKESSGGGQWHGIDYQKQVIRAEYEHLAIVPDPRYSESVILTPEQFKAYNSEKEQELLRFANSKGDKKMGFKLFKREKVENSTDYENLLVELPKSKREVSISTLINEADMHEEKKHAPQMANGEHKVKVGDDEMSVNELIEKHMAACNELAELKKKKEENADLDSGEKEGEKEEKEAHYNDEMAELEKKHKNAIAELAKKHGKTVESKKEDEEFDKLKNAHNTRMSEDRVVEISEDRLARGRSKYGSSK